MTRGGTESGAGAFGPTRTVLVTGAGRGLGAAIAETFAAAGWHVIGTARDPERLAGGPAGEAHAFDLSDVASARALAGALARAGRPIDLLVNNAGTNPKDRGDADHFATTFRIVRFDAANVAESMWTNALVPTELVSRLLPILTPDAVVLNVSSWLGSIGGKTGGGHYGYAGSKALLNMFTRAMALEFAAEAEGRDGAPGRAAVAFNPGWMCTDMGGARADTAPEDVAGRILAMYEDGTLAGANGRFLNADGTGHAW